MIYLTIIAALQLVVIAGLLWDRAVERNLVYAERATLLQRIAAPEAAAIEHQLTHTVPDLVQPVAMDDDEAFHATREDLARALARNAE